MKRLITFIFLLAFTTVFGQTRIYNHNIDGMGWIQYRDTLKADFSIQDYYFIARDGFRFSLESQNSNTAFRYDLFTKDGDGTDNVVFNIFAKGQVSDATNAEKLRLWYNAALTEYCLTADTNGTGLFRPLLISTDGSGDQLRVLTDGNISIRDTIKSATWGGVEIDTSTVSRDALLLQGYDTTAFVTIQGEDTIYGKKILKNNTIIQEGAGSGLAPNAIADNLNITNSTNVGMSISTIAGGNANLFFSEAGNSNKASHIQFIGSVDELRLGASNFNTLRISNAKTRIDTILEVYTDGVMRFQTEGDGTLNVGATANYETLVTDDDDIPNKKYVDDMSTSGEKSVWLNTEEASTMSSTSRSFLGTSGAYFLGFGGNNPDDEESGWTFQIPKDYASGGRIDIYFVTAATTDSVQFEIDVTIANVGESTSTVTESIAAMNSVGSPASWDLATIQDFIITSGLAVDDLITLRIHRDASDLPDTYAGDAFIQFVEFEYNY